MTEDQQKSPVADIYEALDALNADAVGDRSYVWKADASDNQDRGTRYYTDLSTGNGDMAYVIVHGDTLVQVPAQRFPGLRTKFMLEEYPILHGARLSPDPQSRRTRAMIATVLDSAKRQIRERQHQERVDRQQQDLQRRTKVQARDSADRERLLEALNTLYLDAANERRIEWEKDRSGRLGTKLNGMWYALVGSSVFAEVDVPFSGVRTSWLTRHCPKLQCTRIAGDQGQRVINDRIRDVAKYAAQNASPVRERSTKRPAAALR
jgi:hypothetical protein